MARPTNLLNIISSMTKKGVFEKRVEVVMIADGATALMRGTDGNAYEVTIRPAQYSKHPSFKRFVSKDSK